VALLYHISCLAKGL